MQVDLGGFDRGAVGFDRALVLRDQRDLRVERLARHRVLRGQALIAGRDRPARPSAAPGRAPDCRWPGPASLHTGRGVDFGDQVAFLDLIAFLEIDLQQIAADLASMVTVASDVTVPSALRLMPMSPLPTTLGHDRHRRARCGRAPAGSRRALLLGPPDDAGDDQQQQQAGRDKSPGRTRLRCRRRAERTRFAAGAWLPEEV